tara:strand:- start:878 stop:1036 length:159 start_codon:yes stop_codon:yes gene_type:complete
MSERRDKIERNFINLFEKISQAQLEVDKERGAVTPLSNDKPLSNKKVGQDEW